MRRLYSNFAQGPPGIGLLLIRLVVGFAGISYEISRIRSGPALEYSLFHVLCLGLDALLIVGLWTPVAGTLLAFTALWSAFEYPVHRWPSLVIAALGVALALLGPGMWSIDARLFGWKRLKINGKQ